jgi:hypothetical protein
VLYVSRAQQAQLRIEFFKFLVAMGVVCEVFALCALRSAVKSAKAGLREQEASCTRIPRAERRPVVQAKRSGVQLLASYLAAAV